jgi:hypothetical protein
LPVVKLLVLHEGIREEFDDSATDLLGTHDAILAVEEPGHGESVGNAPQTAVAVAAKVHNGAPRRLRHGRKIPQPLQLSGLEKKAGAHRPGGPK